MFDKNMDNNFQYIQNRISFEIFHPDFFGGSFTINVTSVPLPGIQLNNIEMENPILNYNLPGSMDYDDLNIEFFVTKGLVNWFVLRKWMLNLYHHREAGRNELIHCNGALTIRDNKHNIITTVIYEKLYPKVLAGFDSLNTTEDQLEIMTSAITFDLYRYQLKDEDELLSSYFNTKNKG